MTDLALSEPRTFYANGLKFVLIAVAVGAGSLFGLGLGLGGSWEGWLIFLFGAALCGFCCMLAVPQYLKLTVEPEGFSFRSGFRTKTYKWADVWNFRIPPARKVGRRWSHTVVFDFSSMGPPTRWGKMRGWDEFLPETFGHEAEELVQLMQGWRDRAAGGGSAV